MIPLLVEYVILPIINAANEKIKERLGENAKPYLLRLHFVNYALRPPRKKIACFFYIINAMNNPIARLVYEVEMHIRDMTMWTVDKSPRQRLRLEGFWGGKIVPLAVGEDIIPQPMENISAALQTIYSLLQREQHSFMRYYHGELSETLANFAYLSAFETTQPTASLAHWLPQFLQALEDGMKAMLAQHSVKVESISVSPITGNDVVSHLHPGILDDFFTGALPPFFWVLTAVFTHPIHGAMKVSIPLIIDTRRLSNLAIPSVDAWGIILSPSGVTSLPWGGDVYFKEASPFMNALGDDYRAAKIDRIVGDVKPAEDGMSVASYIVSSLLKAFPPIQQQKPAPIFTAAEGSEEQRVIVGVYGLIVRFSFKIAVGISILLKMWLARKCKVHPTTITWKMVPDFYSPEDVQQRDEFSISFNVYIKVVYQEAKAEIIRQYLGLLSVEDFHDPANESRDFFLLKCKIDCKFSSLRAYAGLLARNIPLSCRLSYGVESQGSVWDVFQGNLPVEDTKQSIKQTFRDFWNRLDSHVSSAQKRRR